MAQQIKKHWNEVLILGIGLALLIIGITVIGGLRVATNDASAADATGTVEVTATVQPWITFSLTPTSTTLSPELVDSGGSLHVGSSTSITLGLGTNAVSGWQITIQGKYGGLCHSTATGTSCGTTTENLITTVALSGSTTLSTTLPGSDGYGANATTATTGASIYSYYSDWGTDKVGAIASSSSQVLANKGTPNASTTVAYLKIKATSDQAQKSGNYYDTVTLTATSIP